MVLGGSGVSVCLAGLIMQRSIDESIGDDLGTFFYFYFLFYFYSFYDVSFFIFFHFRGG